MGKRRRAFFQPGPTAAVGAATVVLTFALTAAWIQADTPPPGGPLTVTRTEDGSALVVSGGLPSEEVRDDLFAVLAEEAGVAVIVSEVAIVPREDPLPSVDVLAQALLDDLG